MTVTESAIDPEALARLPEFYHPVVSPDGTEIACYYDVHGRNDLYLIDRETGDLAQVTDGEVPRSARWHVCWAQDGSAVYYHLDDAGDEQNDIARWVPGDGTETVLEVDGQAIIMDTTQDGRHVLYASDEGEQLNLYRFDTQTGDAEQVTTAPSPVMMGVFGPADDRIAYQTNERDALENRDVYVMAADGTDKRRLEIGVVGSETSVVGWHPEGDRLVVSDNGEGLRRVGLYDLGTDDVVWFGPHDAEESPVGVSPDGRYLVATRTRRGATVPVVYDLEGTSEEQTRGRELEVPEGVASFSVGRGMAFVDERTIVFAHSRPDARKELYEYDLETDDSSVVLEASYDDVDPDGFVDAEYVTYESEDGREIGGLLYDPRNGPARSADEQVPAVVHVHGGPHSRYSKSFNLMAQFLATRGYAVFQPNYRGSTGRGREFKQAILGDWGGMEQVDIAAAGRWLEGREWIDEDRVAVYGGSYGGYSVYCQLTMHPDQWAAGIASVGITDLHRLYEEDMAHFQYILRQQMGDPEDDDELWRERSPIEHVDDLEAPLSIVHGVNDPRCPIDQARLFRDAMLECGFREGEDFEYNELGAEGHGSTDIEQKVRKFDLLDDFLERRL